jgi:hypothetical protein
LPRAWVPFTPETDGETTVTMGRWPRPMLACRAAAREMIDEVIAEYSRSPELAWCTSGVIGNLRLSEGVDASSSGVRFTTSSPRIFVNEARCHTRNVAIQQARDRVS